MLATPAAVARKPARRGAAPVEAVVLLVPGRVLAVRVGDLARPVPRGGIYDVVIGGYLRLGEDGEKVVNHAIGIGALEEAVCGAEGRGEADVRHSSPVCDEAQIADRVFLNVVKPVLLFEDAGRRVGRAGHARV